MRVKVKTILLILLYSIVFGCENCFYLIDADKINISGVINYTDIFLVLAVLFIVIVYIMYTKMPRVNYKFGWIIVGIIFLTFTSTIQSNLLYDQSFTMGLRPQRFLIIWGLMYFAVNRLIKIGVFDVRDIIKMLYFLGVCEIVLYIIQYVVGSNFTFLYVLTRTRYGDSRYYFYTLLIRFVLFICLDRVMHNKKVVSSIVLIIAVMVILGIVCKVRMTLLATIIAIGVGLILWRKGGSTKFFVWMLAICAAVLLFNTQIIQDTIIEISGYLDGNLVTTSTLNIRNQAHKHYIHVLCQYPILGGGFPSSLNAVASQAAGFNDSILLVDNGLWAFAYTYGGLGVAWLIGMFTCILVSGWKIFRRYNIYYLFLIPFGWLIAGQTEAMWYFDNGFILLALLLVLIENYPEFVAGTNDEIA